MAEDNEHHEEKVLAQALAMFDEAAKEPKLTLAQVHALLFLAAETQVARKLDRLPTVSNVAKATGFSASGASRLMASLLKDGLVFNDRGIMGKRAEAFVLSPRGKERVTRMLEVLSGTSVADLSVHSFVTFAHSRYAPREATGRLSMVNVAGDPRAYLVNPADDVLSEEIREWCQKNMSRMPQMQVVRGGVRVEFHMEDDAFHFKMRWV